MEENKLTPSSQRRKISEISVKMPRLSTPIKVLSITALAYVILLGLWALLGNSLSVDYQDSLWGLPVRYAYWGSQILVVAIVATATSYIFLDRPIRKLADLMYQAQEGDFLVRASTTRSDEVGNLAQSFNEMLGRITDLTAGKIQTEHDLRYMEEELKFKRSLEEKNQLIEKTNRDLKNLVQDFSLLYEIGQRINQTVEVSELYKVIAEVLRERLTLSDFSLMTWLPERKNLETKAAFGFDPTDQVLEVTFKEGEGIAGEAVKTGQMIHVRDVSRDPRFVERKISLEGSMLSMPLKYKGEILGVVNFGRNETDAFSKHDLRMLKLVANQVALAMANAKLFTRTRELSVTDELTGVYNRRHFQQAMVIEWKRSVRFKRDLSLLMVDVDYFKTFNDTYGHLKGDEVLRKMGLLLKDNLREVDTVARFGGEEFVILLPDTDKHGAKAVAEKLRHLIEQATFLSDAKEAIITSSVGVANYPKDVLEMDDLIDHADIALYEAKDRGRNQVLCYEGHPAALLPSDKPQEAPIEDWAKDRVVH